MEWMVHYYVHNSLSLNVPVEWRTILFHIREVPGSNLKQEADSLTEAFEFSTHSSRKGRPREEKKTRRTHHIRVGLTQGQATGRKEDEKNASHTRRSHARAGHGKKRRREERITYA
jgi:hypothetical protein